MSAWQEYKKAIGDARPWHLLNSSNYLTDDEAQKRYSTCLECPELIQVTKQCKQCGCVMTLKTKLRNTICPLGKW